MRKASTLRIGDLRKLQDAVAKNPDSAVAHLRLGTALLKARRLKTAEEALRRSVELEPDFAEAWSNLGGLLLSRGDFTGCVEVNRRAQASNPKLVQAHYNEGLGYLYQSEAEQMVVCFERVVELEPKNGGGHYNLAVGLHALGKIEAARASLARSLGLGWSPDPGFLKALERHSGVPFEQEPTMHRPSSRDRTVLMEIFLGSSLHPS